MKIVIYLIFSCCFSFSFSQNVAMNKKHLKQYTGIIPSYEVNFNNELTKIEPTTINITLFKDSLFVSVGLSKWSGTYKAVKTSKKTYELTGQMEGSGIQEILTLYKRKKKLVRKGLFPQPDAELNVKKIK